MSPTTKSKNRVHVMPENYQTMNIQEQVMKTMKAFKYMDSLFDANGIATYSLRHRQTYLRRITVWMLPRLVLQLVKVVIIAVLR